MAKREGLLEWGSPIATPLFSAACPQRGYPLTEGTYGMLMHPRCLWQLLRPTESIAGSGTSGGAATIGAFDEYKR